MLILPLDGYAALDPVCMEDCFRLGRGRPHCAALCERGDGRGLEQQQGLPRNPAFDQLQSPNSTGSPPPITITDPKCMTDCRARGYNYRLCQRQCAL